jgi:hypothetical protein
MYLFAFNCKINLIILYNIINMRAQVKDLLPGNSGFNMEIICNCMEPIYVERQQPTKKYKKVGKEARAKLIRCIQNGWSIINVRDIFIT